ECTFASAVVCLFFFLASRISVLVCSPGGLVMFNDLYSGIQWEAWMRHKSGACALRRRRRRRRPVLAAIALPTVSHSMVWPIGVAPVRYLVRRGLPLLSGPGATAAAL